MNKLLSKKKQCKRQFNTDEYKQPKGEKKNRIKIYEKQHYNDLRRKWNFSIEY
jgi:hypothetical protein